MDANTKDVLMALIALISAVVTPLIVVYVGNRTKKSITDEMGGVKTKVEEYHKEVNGKMGLLLEKTVDLATATEKARAKAETEQKERKQ